MLSLVEAFELRFELTRELGEPHLAGAHELELPSDMDERLFQDPEAFGVTLGSAPAIAQRSARLLGLCEHRELVEGETEQVAQADQLRQTRDIRFAVEPVAPLLSARG